MLQKLVTVDWKKLCEERFVSEGRNPDTMNEEEMTTSIERALDEVLEQQNKAGFRATIIASEVHTDDGLVFLCTESPITTPQHAKLTFPWTVEELNGLTPEEAASIMTLRLKGAVADMNAAHLRVDALASAYGGGLIAIVTEV